MSQINLTVEQLNKMGAFDIAKSDIVRDKFINIYDTLWGAGTGEAAYERESINFDKLLRDTPALQKGTPFSLFTAFIDLAVCGLSLEQGTRALCYLIGRNVNVGTKEQPKWEGRVVLTISAYGELVLRARAGQIRHADNPVLVYDNDEFSFSDKGGRKEVDYTCHLPHNGHKVVACYLRITRADGTIDYSVMTEEDWSRLQGYSGKANKKWDKEHQRYIEQPNALYSANDGAIDTGFLMAKCIKHAFKTYPKVRIGRGTELQSQQVDEKEIEINDELYGVVDPETGEIKQNADAAPQQAEAFGPPANDVSAGVTVDTDDDDAF